MRQFPSGPLIFKPSLGLWLLSLLLLLTGEKQAQAVAPTNDVCSGAEVIPSSVFPYLTSIKDMADATITGDPPLPSCAFGNPFSHSLWYVFTPQDTAFYTISSCADNQTATMVPDTLMAIYTSNGGCAGATNELPSTSNSSGCADDSCGPGFTQASITTRLLADTTYYIVVWWYDNAPPAPGNSSLQLRVSKTLPPSNDMGPGATEVFLNQSVLGTTILAGNDYQLPSGLACFTGLGQIGNAIGSTAPGRDVVYSFTAPVATNYSIKVNNYKISCWDKNGHCYDLVLYVASALPLGPAPATVTNCLSAAFRAYANNAEEIFCLHLEAGQKIYIFVDENQLSPEGSSFTLEVTQCIRESEPSKPNNSWTNANLYTFGIEGSIQPAADVDFYSLGTPPADSRVFAMVDGGAANITAMQMRVVAGSPGVSTNTLEFDSDNNDAIFGEKSPNVAGTPLNGAPAFLRINGSQGAVEPYRLFAVVQPPMAAATVETEPNNTPVQANSGPNNYFSGTLSTAADVDVYSFSVERVDGVSELLFLSLDCDPLRNGTPVNAKLELLDDSGNVLVTVDDNYLSSASSTNTVQASLTATVPYSPGEALIFRASGDGTYYARVSSSPNANLQNNAGDYLLSIARNGFVGCCGINTAPTQSGSTVTSPIPENAFTTLTTTIVDPDAGQSHQLFVDWGDGSAVTVTNLLPWINMCSFPHQYLDSNSSNTYRIRVTVSDNAGDSSWTYLNVIVTNVPPAFGTAAITSPISPNDTATLTGTFSDPGSQDTFSLSINWGDGSIVQTTNLLAGASSFSLSHKYTISNSNAPVSLVLHDNQGGVTTTNLTVTIGPSSTGPQLQMLSPWTSGHVMLQLQGTPTTSYRIQTSASLSGWAEFVTRITDANGRFTVEDTNAPSPNRRFYRAVTP